MTIVNPPVPVPGPRGTEETNAASAIVAILADYNGNITDANLSAAAAIASGKLADVDKLGLTVGGTTRRGVSTVATSESTASVTPADLATVGPSITLTVGVNGLVAIFAQADITVPVGVTGSVHLFEDATDLGTILSAGTTVATTAYTQAGAGNGTANRLAASALVFPASAGVHVYKLKYLTSGVPAATFANRVLRAWTTGF